MEADRGLKGGAANDRRVQGLITIEQDLVKMCFLSEEPTKTIMVVLLKGLLLGLGYSLKRIILWMMEILGSTLIVLVQNRVPICWRIASSESFFFFDELLLFDFSQHFFFSYLNHSQISCILIYDFLLQSYFTVTM